jgi:hypothetical protein
MRRMLRGLVLAACAAAVLAPIASAAAPQVRADAQSHKKKKRQHVPDFNATVRGICSFPVQVRTLVNEEIQTTFPDGHFVIRGKLVLALKNVRNGHRTVINASGPGKFFPHPGGRVVAFLRGRTFIFTTARVSGQGHPIMWLTKRGVWKVVVDPQGNARVVKLPNRHVDLCARIARRV